MFHGEPMIRAKAILELCILSLLAAFLGGGGLLLHHLNIALDTASERLTAATSDASDTLSRVNNVLQQVSDTVSTVEGTAKTEQGSVRQGTREALKVATDAHDLLAHTDITLNCRRGAIGCPDGGLVPAAAAIVVQAQGELAGASQELQPIAANFTQASNALAVGLSQDMPLLRDSLIQLRMISLDSAGIASDAHEETTLIVGKTREAFAPQNKFLTVLKALGGGTLSVAELVYYLRN